MSGTARHSGSGTLRTLATSCSSPRLLRTSAIGCRTVPSWTTSRAASTLAALASRRRPNFKPT
eukprot:10048747-Alexandrium_andersonii.AAC.1